MEAKSSALSAVIIGALLMGLFLGMTPVEAKSCCRDTTARNCYNVCRVPGTPREVCAKLCDCIIISGNKCPSNYPSIRNFLNMANIEETYTTTEFCKLGCASSVCGNIIALQKSAVVKEAVEHCNNGCFHLCNKKSNIAVVVDN
ncbi:hypothetical protein MKW92_040240 [Papaver armeniacum]|nr:hypothetical protein MKW92_040240 [Papaver armeniacum]